MAFLDDLKTEIQTDPKSLGYSALINDLQLVADKLNEVGASGETIEVSSISSIEAQKAVEISEFVALSEAAQRGWQIIMNFENIPVGDSFITAQIAAIWGAGTTTRANLLALKNRSASRAEVLFGENRTIKYQEVGEALNS